MKKSDIKKHLIQDIWVSEDYYKIASCGSMNESHPGMRLLKDLAKNAKNILDMGCGDGTRLNNIATLKKNAVGVDISKFAIEKARKKYPKINFKVGELEDLRLKNNSFDLVYSAFVLEHLSNPEKVINEAVGVTKNKGVIVLMAPNYGAPNRSSPPFKESRAVKFFIGIYKDIMGNKTANDKMNWREVVPLTKDNRYEIDWDVTVEPYLGSLITYLQKSGLKIDYASSCWDQELSGAKVHQKLFRLMGKFKIFPFWMWGPHLLVVARKI